MLFPYNKFSEIQIRTGPVFLTISIYKSIELNLLEEVTFFQPGVLFSRESNNNYQCTELYMKKIQYHYIYEYDAFRSKYYKNLKYVVGNDRYSGSWHKQNSNIKSAIEYKNHDDHSTEIIDFLI